MSDLKQFGLSVLNIPDELKHSMQWAVSSMKIIDPQTGRKDKAPRNPLTGELIKVTSSEGWGTFDDAVNSGYPAIGMRLTADDPYTVIDLDRSRSEEENTTARNIYDAFDSYAEKSQSGNGVHVIIRGPAEPGRRRNNVEVYSQERYIICTGMILRNKPISEGGKALESLKKSLDLSDNPDILPIVQYEDERESDHQVLHKMFSAQNGEKVKALYETKPAPHQDWSQLDAQLAQHICFYTRNPAQALRLFRGSALYRNGTKRGYENVRKYEEDYLVRRTFNKAWSLEIARAEEKERSIEQINEMIKNNLSDSLNETAKYERLKRMEDEPLPAIQIPSGLMGEIAKYIYQTAPRPVWEVAVAGAISMLSGIAGRHYNINGSGLGLYIVLLAKTGRGKEAANAGISYLMDEVCRTIPSATLFRGPSHIASGQGLIRTMADGQDDEYLPSKFVILSEFGHTLSVICAREATAADMRTRQALLDMFSKNSWGSVIKESAYADKQNNTREIKSPNLSILGDTTPETFFKSVSLDIVNEGFLPRFLVIEYDGPRVPSNYGINRTPSTDLVTRMQVLISQVMTLRDTNQCINIRVNDEAKAILDAFDIYCDEKINVDDAVSECWNRAHLQALRLAGNVAVGNNIFEPVVTARDAEYAVSLIKRGVLSLDKRFHTGAYGGDDRRQEYELRHIIHDFFAMDDKTKKEHRVAPGYIKQGFLPMNYLSRTCASRPVFDKSSRGLTMTLNTTINALIAQGDISEVDSREVHNLDRKVTTRADRLFSKGINYDVNWTKENDEDDLRKNADKAVKENTDG